MAKKRQPRRRTLLTLQTLRASGGGDLPDTRPVAEFLYTRISDDPEGRELGVDRQEEDLRASVRADYPQGGVRVFAGKEEYSDNDISASTNCDEIRPGYARLLGDARDAARSGEYRMVQIRAYTSARLTRRPREYEDQIDLAQDYGVRFKFLRSPSFDLNTANGRRIGRIMAAQDAGLPEDISEQVLRAQVQQLINGEYTGGLPGFGFRLAYDYNANGLPIKPGRLVIHDDEAAMIRDAARRVLAGDDLAAIAREWSTTLGTKRWPADVAHLLTTGRIAGLNERWGETWGRGQWGKPVNPNDPESEWSAIITESELAALRAKLPEQHRAGHPRRWLGAGLYRCGKPGCDGMMKSTGPARPGGPRRYMCNAAWHVAIPAADVDKHVRAQVCLWLSMYGANLLAGKHLAEHEQLTAEVNRLNAKIKELALAFADSPQANARALVIATQPLEEKLANIERQREKLVTSGRELDGIADAEDPVAAFLSAGLSKQRAVVKALCEVTIKPGKTGRQPATAKLIDRVAIEQNVTGMAA